MENPKYEIGVIVGRFQVNRLHTAHRKLIQTVIDNHPKVLIFLGVSPASPTQRDPLDFQTRKAMIMEEFSDPSITILPIGDTRSNQYWSQVLDQKIQETYLSGKPILYGSRDSFIPNYHGKYDTKELEPIEYVSGTDIREQLSHSVISDPNFRAGAIYTVNQMYPIMYSTVDAFIYKHEDTEMEPEVLIAQKPNERGWRLPGGFVDPTDDSDEIAIKREIREECGGIEVSNPKYIMSARINDWRYRNQLERKIMTRLYMCKYTWGSPTPGDDINKLKWVSFTEVENMIDEGDIVEGHIQLINSGILHLK